MTNHCWYKSGLANSIARSNKISYIYTEENDSYFGCLQGVSFNKAVHKYQYFYIGDQLSYVTIHNKDRYRKFCVEGVPEWQCAYKKQDDKAYILTGDNIRVNLNITIETDGTIIGNDINWWIG